MLWMKVTVLDTTERTAYVPLPDATPEADRERLARAAVEHCDGYGNIPETDEDISIDAVEEVDRPPGRFYMEDGVLKALPDDLLLKFFDESEAEPAMRGRHLLAGKLRQELARRGLWSTPTPPPAARTGTVTIRRAAASPAELELARTMPDHYRIVD